MKHQPVRAKRLATNHWQVPLGAAALCLAVGTAGLLATARGHATFPQVATLAVADELVLQPRAMESVPAPELPEFAEALAPAATAVVSVEPPQAEQPAPVVTPERATVRAANAGSVAELPTPTPALATPTPSPAATAIATPEVPAAPITTPALPPAPTRGPLPPTPRDIAGAAATVAGREVGANGVVEPSHRPIR